MRRYGAWPLVVLASTLAVEAGERLSLSQAIDGIQEEFGVSDFALGFLAAAMTFVGVIGAVPIGILADRWRRTALLAGAMVIWTICIGFNALAPGFAFLLAARIGIGAVEANSPAAFSLLSDYYPVRDRARIMGRYQMGSAAGGLIGIALAGVLVDTFGWRAAFWMWVPLGGVVVLMLLRLPEPRRGDQDRAFQTEMDEAAATADATTTLLNLPPPLRTCDLDYSTASWREVLRELRRIRSMWFGVLSLTISQFLLLALQFWGVEFFKRAHDLSASEAGAFLPAIGGGVALGFVGGGAIADRLLHRGIVNARVYVAAWSSVVAAAILVPALLVDSLVVSTIGMFLGTMFLTVPIAPSEAIVSDVVPSELRGRAASVRAVVRSVAALSPLIVGALSDLMDQDLAAALAAITPLYAIGGLVMLFAARSYPSDLAFVAAESRRTAEWVK